VRLAKRLERAALVGLGIAAGSAMLAAVLGGSLLAQDQSVQRAASHLRPADRAVRAFWLAIPAQGAPWRTLDRQTRSALGEISGRRAVGAMLYREASIRGPARRPRRRRRPCALRPPALGAASAALPARAVRRRSRRTPTSTT
jgi:hypothetical protein